MRGADVRAIDLTTGDINTQVIAAMDRAIEMRREADTPRDYLGLSRAGDECPRRMWYAFRFIDLEDWKPRALRRAESGHIWEDRVARDLNAGDLQLVTNETELEILRDSGRVTRVSGAPQFAVGLEGGHIRGHLDGLVRGVHGYPFTEWMLWENKATGGAKYVWEDETYTRTAENKTTKTRASQEGNWFRFRRQGLKRWNPVYYAQMQVYMHLWNEQHAQRWGFEINRGLMTVINTDTDEIAAEIIHLDDMLAAHLVSRARTIVHASEPPARAGTHPGEGPCRFCAYQAVCHGSQGAIITCRSCVHARPVSEGTVHPELSGRWVCDEGHEIKRHPLKANVPCGEEDYQPVRVK